MKLDNNDATGKVIIAHLLVIGTLGTGGSQVLYNSASHPAKSTSHGDNQVGGGREARS
jgi:hypothetical protein